MEAVYVFGAGSLLRGDVRRTLQKWNFVHGLIWMENKGLFESEFVVKGEPSVVQHFMESLMGLCKCLACSVGMANALKAKRSWLKEFFSK